MAEPLVSVVIPTYNRAQFICEAVDSILAQTYKNCELIVVDDGSTDNTKDVLERYRDHLIYLYQPNKGPGAARNLGISQAKGEFIAFLDSDDRWLPEKLSLQMELFKKYPSTGIVGCGEYCIDVDGQRTWEGFVQPQLDIKQLIVRNLLWPSRVVIRKGCFDLVGLFDKTLLHNEDWDMWLCIAKHFEIRNVVQPLVEMRVHNTSRHNRTMEVRFEHTKKVIDRHVTCKKDRKKAYSWMYYKSAWRSFHWMGQRVKPLYHLFLSFCNSPHKACPGQRRMLLLLECVLPKFAFERFAVFVKNVKAVKRRVFVLAGNKRFFGCKTSKTPESPAGRFTDL